VLTVVTYVSTEANGIIGMFPSSFAGDYTGRDAIIVALLVN